MRSRLIPAAFTAALVAFALTACGSSDEGDSKSAAVASSTSSAPEADPTEEWLTAARTTAAADWPEDAAPADHEIALYPDLWCAELSKGHSVGYLLDTKQGEFYPIGETWGTQIDTARKLVVAAVGVACPELKDQVTADLREAGVY
ncbi:hypothetical protein ACH4E8_14175 [Streptomyces sp. NPDC017979]|uniref:hypothetical protein n=1 Tax=Streptomyces sp. NPDC017979 TaxID=3365024 RepID=UPI00378E8D00